MKLELSAATLIIFTILVFTSCQSQDNLEGLINKECDSLIASGDIKSLSIGVIKNGKVYKYHKGKLTNGISPNDQTLYEIASLTKTFTGTLLAKAISDSKVGLDDDIRKYLPESYPNLEFNEQPITFRNLVTHTSGLPNMFPNQPEMFQNPNWDELPFKINKLQAGFTKKQFLTELHQVKLDTVPGHKFSYSNAGANLLAYCLERIYERPYEDLMKTYILTPLKMDNTYVGISKENRPFLAKGLNANGIEMPARVEKELQAEGGMISTLDDMIKYLRFQLESDNPLVKISHQELLNGKYGDFENGLFWQIFKNGDKPTKIFQNGGAFGTSSWLTTIPETKTGVFIITNVSGPEIHQKLSGLADKIIEQNK
ncbi:serine hydrolase domain-containing protein [Gramella sp. AN32]|uniref:Serine hydrolase domain-containing protein n=1 Tax=Christiangramia antarctica TaxID=2058158 RepID=A0ABW5XBZ6_9FLAO|nr:serine hydrolase domain-containing protein [Gramella sp. AN32]MCM4157622.1 serine hydrolase [Gramella sp. AN32]